MHQEIKDNQWLYPLHSEYILKPEDFKAFINPKLKAVTDMNEFGFE